MKIIRVEDETGGKYYRTELLVTLSSGEMVSGAVRRLRAALEAADRGGYGKTGWYSYVNRDDVEAVLEAVEGAGR